jgi:5-methylcytosine-specific restriction endonuclease McrA
MHKRVPFARAYQRAGGRAWQATRRRIFARDDHRCRYCGRVVTLATDVVDHIMNLAAGGNDDDSNLAACCRACNERKRRAEALRGRGSKTSKRFEADRAHEPCFSPVRVFPDRIPECRRG